MPKKVKIIKEIPSKVKELKEEEREESELEEDIDESEEENFSEFMEQGGPRTAAPLTLVSGQPTSEVEEVPVEPRTPPAGTSRMGEEAEARRLYEVRRAEQEEKKYEAIILRGERQKPVKDVRAKPIDQREIRRAQEMEMSERALSPEERRERKYRSPAEQKGKRYAWEA